MEDNGGCLFVLILFVLIFFVWTGSKKDYEYTTVLEYSDGTRETVKSYCNEPPYLREEGCVLHLGRLKNETRCSVRKIICTTKKEIE